jgi:hypothetical protein
MEGLQVAGVIAFIYGVLWASSTLRDARSALPSEHLEPVRRIERNTVANSLGPVLPLILGLGAVSLWQHHAVGVAVAAILLTVSLVAMRGVAHAKRMLGLGIPRDYASSYRRAHVIRATSLAIVAATLVKPLIA